MSYDHDVHRELGSLTARMSAVERDVTALDAKVDEILAILNQGKGGWKTVVALGSISAAVGALAAKVAPFLFAIPGK